MQIEKFYLTAADDILAQSTDIERTIAEPFQFLKT